MKLSKSILILLILTLLMPVQSFAGSFRGNPFYFSVGGAYVVMEDSKNGSVDPFLNGFLKQNDFTFEFEDGMGATTAAGLVLKRRFRVEFEYGYREVSPEQSSILNPPGIIPNRWVDSLEGDLSIQTLMVNGSFDFRNSSRFTPYVGAGLGMGLVELSDLAVTTFANVPITFPDGDDEVFAYQLYAGVGYWIFPQLIGYAEYRYLGTGDANLNNDIYTIDTHNFELGLRFYLGRP